MRVKKDVLKPKRQDDTRRFPVQSVYCIIILYERIITVCTENKNNNDYDD